MSELCQITAVVRTEMLDRVIHLLQEAGVPRMNVIPIHAIGRGADPTASRLSVEAGTKTGKKSMVWFVCAAERCDMYTELIAGAAITRRQGDGIVYVTPVLNVTKIRTGAVGLEALE
jgi:nitrogen regulatory protein PII